MSRVQVLLSSYNGENYITEQITSILNQKDYEVELLIRDDGSTDCTVDLLERFALNHKNIKIIKGKNIGVVRSFFELIQHSANDVSYFAFSDQDDVWKEDKISRAVTEMENKKFNNKPIAYCSSTTEVDEHLTFLNQGAPPKRPLTINNALIENVVTGCTMVINNKARDLLINRKLNMENVLMHDWWVYQVITLLGEVIYDPDSRILYRQHSGNVIGGRRGLLNFYLNRIKRFIKKGKKPLLTLQAKELRKTYKEDIPDDKMEIINKFIENRKNFMGRINYAFHNELYRQTLIDNLIFRILIVMNRV